MLFAKANRANMRPSIQQQRRQNVLKAAQMAQRSVPMVNQDDNPAEEPQVASHFEPTSPLNAPLEPYSPEMPQSPIVAPINEVGLNQDVAHVAPLNTNTSNGHRSLR